MSKEYIIQSKITRNYPDPIYYQTKGIKYHVCMVDIHELYKSARDIVLEANPRDHSESKLSNSRVVRAIREEYLNETNKFHQKNSGITIIAETVEELGSGKIKFTVDEAHGGITNGGTTYRTLMNAVSEIRNEDIGKLPQHQFVKIEIRSKVPTEWISDISGGLNTHAQVQDTALLNLGGELNFIKEVLDKKPYGKKIAYKQNEEGEWDIDKILCLMELFDVNNYKNSIQSSFPIRAYSSKASVIKSFKERLEVKNNSGKEENFHLLMDIVHDILVLHDTIREDFYDVLKKNLTSQPGGLKYVRYGKKVKVKGEDGKVIKSKSGSSKQKRQTFYLPILDKEVDYDLLEACLYPILGAFRVCAHSSSDKDMVYWKLPFQDIIKLWKQSAPILLKATHEVYLNNNGNVRSIGVTSTAWQTCYLLLKSTLDDFLKNK